MAASNSMKICNHAPGKTSTKFDAEDFDFFDFMRTQYLYLLMTIDNQIWSPLLSRKIIFCEFSKKETKFSRIC